MRFFSLWSERRRTRRKFPIAQYVYLENANSVVAKFDELAHIGFSALTGN